MSDPATPISDRGTKGEITTIEPDRQERALARRGAESRATIPTVEYAAAADVGALLAREPELGRGLAAAVIAAAAQGLRAVPRLNGSYRDGRYELYARVNVGVTLSGDGLYATPTINDADELTAAVIGDQLEDLYERAREDELHPADLAGATFTVVDASAYPDVAVTPLILPPQAGALAFGPLRQVAVVRGGELVPGTTLRLSLAVDHRIVHAHHAATFLEEVKALLEEARI
ncbi:MAG: 2-oxo acid dehydrogenase subunit E2 [Acidobacteriota bacterium]|nr:2-oxo acid dehydrogenase subunit E2 [Acidobacteriota bacterium]